MPDAVQGPHVPGQAAQGPVPEPVSAAANPAPALHADSPAQARGRKTLSTAFVRVGPDGQLTVELTDGRVLVLRDVAMRRKDFCGVHVAGGAPFCGSYAEVGAARPGGAAAGDGAIPATANPIGPRGGAAPRD